MESFQMGDLTLRNRIALAPMTRARAGESHLVTPAALPEAHRARAHARRSRHVVGDHVP